ncbi:uncharacterized protein LOC128396238 [Panonychus citri]|uniref:uncharacterized protein LOC128396238 n=1 Tax=Panonychus citri TaxID=50023 RepID=UPI002306EFD4|nr:uncharacterized protein LOC128396238 [Panonychus citri]
MDNIDWSPAISISEFKPDNYSDSDETSESDKCLEIQMDVSDNEDSLSVFFDKGHEEPQSPMTNDRRNEPLRINQQIPNVQVLTPKWKSIITMRRFSEMSMETDSIDNMSTRLLLNQDDYQLSQEVSTPRNSVSSISFSPAHTSIKTVFQMPNPVESGISTANAAKLTNETNDVNPKDTSSNINYDASTSKLENVGSAGDKSQLQGKTLEGEEEIAEEETRRLKKESDTLYQKTKMLYEEIKAEKAAVMKEKLETPKPILDHFVDYDSENTDDEDFSGDYYEKHLKYIEFHKKKSVYRKKRSAIIKWMKLGWEVKAREDMKRAVIGPSSMTGQGNPIVGDSSDELLHGNYDKLISLLTKSFENLSSNSCSLQERQLLTLGEKVLESIETKMGKVVEQLLDVYGRKTDGKENKSKQDCQQEEDRAKNHPADVDNEDDGNNHDEHPKDQMTDTSDLLKLRDQSTLTTDEERVFIDKSINTECHPLLTPQEKLLTKSTQVSVYDMINWDSSEDPSPLDVLFATSNPSGVITLKDLVKLTNKLQKQIKEIQENVSSYSDRVIIGKTSWDENLLGDTVENIDQIMEILIIDKAENGKISDDTAIRISNEFLDEEIEDRLNNPPKVITISAPIIKTTRDARQEAFSTDLVDTLSQTPDSPYKLISTSASEVNSKCASEKMERQLSKKSTWQSVKKPLLTSDTEKPNTDPSNEVNNTQEESNDLHDASQLKKKIKEMRVSLAVVTGTSKKRPRSPSAEKDNDLIQSKKQSKNREQTESVGNSGVGETSKPQPQSKISNPVASNNPKPLQQNKVTTGSIVNIAKLQLQSQSTKTQSNSMNVTPKKVSPDHVPTTPQPNKAKNVTLKTKPIDKGKKVVGMMKTKASKKSYPETDEDSIDSEDDWLGDKVKLTPTKNEAKATRSKAEPLVESEFRHRRIYHTDEETRKLQVLAEKVVITQRVFEETQLRWKTFLDLARIVRKMSEYSEPSTQKKIFRRIQRTVSQAEENQLKFLVFDKTNGQVIVDENSE